jgi:hypothetical protein
MKFKSYEEYVSETKEYYKDKDVKYGGVQENFHKLDGIEYPLFHAGPTPQISVPYCVALCQIAGSLDLSSGVCTACMHNRPQPQQKRTR